MHKISVKQVTPGEPAMQIFIDGMEITGVKGINIRRQCDPFAVVTMEIQTADLEYFEHPEQEEAE